MNNVKNPLSFHLVGQTCCIPKSWIVKITKNMNDIEGWYKPVIAPSHQPGVDRSHCLAHRFLPAISASLPSASAATEKTHGVELTRRLDNVGAIH